MQLHFGSPGSGAEFVVLELTSAPTFSGAEVEVWLRNPANLHYVTVCGQIYDGNKLEAILLVNDIAARFTRHKGV